MLSRNSRVVFDMSAVVSASFNSLLHSTPSLSESIAAKAVSEIPIVFASDSLKVLSPSVSFCDMSWVLSAVQISI